MTVTVTRVTGTVTRVTRDLDHEVREECRCGRPLGELGDLARPGAKWSRCLADAWMRLAPWDPRAEKLLRICQGMALQ